jgi:dolichol kinase
LFPLALYPIVTFLEKFPRIIGFFNQREKGEVRKSLILAFFMMALLILVFWGWLGEHWKYIIIVSVMAWGYGDAAAALVGKALGRNHIRHPWVEGTKTREGTIAMYVVSTVIIFFILMLYSALPWFACLAGALLVAPICSVVELISRNGLDNVTVPLATAVPIFLLIMLFKG